MARIKNLTPTATLGRGSYVAVDTDEDTYRFDIGAALQSSGDISAYYDEASGRYHDLNRWLAGKTNGKIYGVLIPKFSYTTGIACTKTGANAGLSVTPATASDPGSDDYADEAPFLHWTVNGGAETSGAPYATAFQLCDTSFSLRGANGNVWELAPVLYWRYTEQDTGWLLEICDQWLDGFRPQPGAWLPDGTLRPFMLYAKYPGGLYNGSYASVSGVPLLNRTVSHNSLITLTSSASTGYSGKSIADDWYVKVMFLLKYAVKSSQSVFAGCTGYTLQCYPTVAETGVKRVIVSNSDAASIEVGSAMMLGDQSTSTNDRGNASCYNVFDGLTVTRKEAYDSSNTAVYFKSDSTFDVTTACRLSTAPWPCGCLDSVQGSDGTLTAAGRTNGREPFRIQGIECMHGAYEVLSGVILNAAEIDGELKVEVHVAYDTADDATSITSAFADTGVSLPTDSAAGWLCCTDIANAGGFLVPSGQGASTSTGLGDGHYQNVATSKGTREFLGLGYLDNWGAAGLFCGDSCNWLGAARWSFGSRLSATGRSRG